MASISSTPEFVPTIGDNHLRKSDDPQRFSVLLKAVTVGKKQAELRKFVNADPKKLAKDLMSDERTSEIRKLLEEHFVEFVNLFRKQRVLNADLDRELMVLTSETPGAEKVELKGLKVGADYYTPMTLADLFDLGELELLMEMFMHLVGSSQLKPAKKRKKKKKDDEDDEDDDPTVDDEREDEEKN